MVLIHGESYTWGAGHLMDGATLAAKSRMVVVTLNYRLGILGKLPFVCHLINDNPSPQKKNIRLDLSSLPLAKGWAIPIWL